MDLDSHIRRIPDFPKPGILFYDISTLLSDGAVWRSTVRQMAELVEPYRPDGLAAIESRGFLLAAPLAYELGLGFAMIRKPGKLPGPVLRHAYDLEYGSDALEVGEGMVAGGRVVLIDDLIATGGTAAAAVTLLQKIGVEVAGAAFLIELEGLGGAARLGVPARALLRYPA